MSNLNVIAAGVLIVQHFHRSMKHCESKAPTVSCFELLSGANPKMLVPDKLFAAKVRR